MALEKTSAEKDLLRIIENPSSVPPGRNVFPGAKGPARPAQQKGLFASLSPKGAQKSRPFSLSAFLSDKKSMIRFLSIVTFWVFVVFVLVFVQEYLKLQNLKHFGSAPQKGKVAAKVETSSAELEGTETEMPPEEGEKAAPAARNIFKPMAAQKQLVEEGPKDEVAAMLQDYRLVGISVSPNAEESYAMVENAKTKITVFLKKGESLNGAELSSIQEDKLVFKEGGRELELR